MGGEAAASRKMVARAGLTDEESRAYLQARLRLFSGLMFWSFVFLLSFTRLMYWWDPDLRPDNEDTVILISALGLGLLLAIWRLVLARMQLTAWWLHAIDAFYSVTSCTILAAAAYVARDFRPSAYGCWSYAALMLLLRAIVIPSSAMRTAINSIAACIPMIIASVAVALKTVQDLPPPAFVGSAVVLSGGVVLLATISSRVIYGLRRQVSAAIKLGEYTQLQKIGAGGMGVVYRARHTFLRRPTAIKVLPADRVDADTLDRFEREVQATAQLTHPNTIAVFDFGRSPDGALYYAMEYLDGIDLEHLVVKYGPQPADRVTSVLAQVCGALHEAHGMGFTHRDIKPANIILCERGAVPDVAKVVDFGLVTEMTTKDGSSSSGILGTPAYLAPEAVTDPDRIGPAADMYALGAVGYFLLTGKQVFDGATSVDVCLKHVSTPPIPPSEVAAIHIPPPLEQLVLACLAKDPADRPSADDLAKRLRDLAPAADWREADALAWWDEFHSSEEPAAPAPADHEATITVDLDRRGLQTPPPRARPTRAATDAARRAEGKRATRVKRPPTAA